MRKSPVAQFAVERRPSGQFRFFPVSFGRQRLARELPLKRKILLKGSRREEKCDGNKSVQKMH
jgi:hypothetical protein